MMKRPTAAQEKVISFIGRVFEAGSVTIMPLPDPDAVEVTDRTGAHMILAYDMSRQAIIER